MTGKVKLQFEALAAAQKKGTKPAMDQTAAMTLLQGVFAKTSGAMQRLSVTTEGMKSNFADAVDNLDDLLEQDRRARSLARSMLSA